MIKNIIGVTHLKGGVGKTTIVTNLSLALSKRNLKVLVVDLDPQSHLSMNCLGVKKLEEVKGIEDLFENDKLETKDFILKTKHKNLFILPCHQRLEKIISEIQIKKRKDKKNRGKTVRDKLNFDLESSFILKNILEKIDGFDFCLIDVQTGYVNNFLTLQSLIASKKLILPLFAEAYDFPSGSEEELLKIVEHVKESKNPELGILGFCLTRFEDSNVFHLRIEKKINDKFGSTVFKTILNKTIEDNNNVRHEYKALANEILLRLGGLRGSR